MQLNLDLSGPWTAEMYADHLPEPIAFDEGLIRSVIDFYRPQKCLDLGCGLGYFVDYLRTQGVDAWGVEAEDLGTCFKAPGYQIQNDLSQPFDLTETYDLVLCLEVVEHIPQAFEDIVFDNIVRHTNRYLIFSGATPGQHGTGHINEQPENYWFTHLVQRGLVLRHQETVKVRLACTLSWYAKNVSVWELMPANTENWAANMAQRDSHILHCEISLNYLQTQAEQVRSQLEQSQFQFQQSQSELEHCQAQLQQTQTRLEQAQATITTMQASKFWKLRTVWFKLKRAIGLVATN